LDEIKFIIYFFIKEILIEFFKTCDIETDIIEFGEIDSSKFWHGSTWLNSVKFCQGRLVDFRRGRLDRLSVGSTWSNFSHGQLSWILFKADLAKFWLGSTRPNFDEFQSGSTWSSTARFRSRPMRPNTVKFGSGSTRPNSDWGWRDYIWPNFGRSRLNPIQPNLYQGQFD